MKYATLLLAVCMVVAGTSAWAQLPADSVQLGKVKISEAQKTQDLDPVTLKAADPALGTFEYEGVTYGMSVKDSKEKFLADPAKYAGKAEKQRWENNFITAMSRIWCPVTDEVNSGGGLIWHELDMEWESCCQFCNDTKTDEDFPRALDRLKKRAAKAYELMGKATYTEGASSPVEGAIDFGGGMDDEEESTSAGCAPTYLSGAELKPTYTEGVALVFENRCLECHHAGGAAPMSFTTYGDIRKWSAKMKDALTNRTMPPWLADSGAYSTGKRLTDEERDLLLAWIDAGYPQGEGELGFESAYAGDWAIGEPDHVFDLGEHTLAEDKGEHVAEYEIATSFDSDKVVTAAEIHPTDTFLVLEIDAGPLGSYHVGNQVTTLPEGTGYTIKKGETIKVRVFYTKEAGWEEVDDATQIAVKFADSAATTLMTDRLANDDFTIPAGKDGAEATATFTFPADGVIHGVTPVLRERGKTVRVVAKTPDGTETEIVNIPHWDPAWHFTYAPCEGIAAPKGTTVTITGAYDNTDMNAKNPDPEAEVKAGPGGELLEGWLTYSLN